MEGRVVGGVVDDVMCWGYERDVIMGVIRDVIRGVVDSTMR